MTSRCGPPWIVATSGSSPLAHRLEARMVGLTGIQCKPQLSLCMGLSGQVQFAVGIRDSKTIVAINTDENATIFQYADYGIVGDLNVITEKLIAQLK